MISKLRFELFLLSNISERPNCSLQHTPNSNDIFDVFLFFKENKAALIKYDELKKEELSKNFNVIKDKPRSLLTDEINKFFIEITKVIAEAE